MEPVGRQRLVVTATALLCAVLAFGTTLYVPPNMDEMSHYHPIHCLSFSEAAANVFRESCGHYDLRYFGAWLPTRSYYYIGATPSLQYLPLYLLYPEHHSARLLGVVALLLFAWTLRRTSGTPGWIALVLSFLPFPFAFQMLINTGTLHYLCIAAILLPWLAARSRSFLGAVGLGLLLFVGFEQKLIFLAMLPSMAVLTGAFVAERATSSRPFGTHLRELARPLGVTVGVAFLATAALLSGRDRRGALYARELVERDLPGETSPVEHVTRVAAELGVYLGSFGRFGERIYAGNVGLDPTTLAAWVVIAVTLVLGVRFAVRRAVLLGAVAAFVAMAVALVVLGESRHGHHFVLVFPFLLLAVASALAALHGRRPRLAAGLALVLVATQVVTWVGVVRQKPAPHDDWSKVAVLRALQDEGLADRYAYVVLDWGMYYLLALYGPPNQTLLYLEPLRSAETFGQLETAREIAARKDLRLAFVHQRRSASDLQRLSREVPGLERLPIPGLGRRAVWRVRAERAERTDGAGEADPG